MTTLDDFPDTDGLRGEQRRAAEWAVRTGLFKGRSDGRLDPEGVLKRKDYMLVEYRAAGLPGDNVDVPSPPVEPDPDPEPTPDPDPEPEPEPVPKTMRGNLTDPSQMGRGPNPTTRDGQIIERHADGYLSIRHSDVLVHDAYWQRRTTPQTGDHMRIDAVGRRVKNVTLEHFYMGGKTTPALDKDGDPHHLDSIQISAFSGGSVGDVTIRHAYIRGSASGGVFSKKALRDATVTFDDVYAGKASGSYAAVKLYSEGGCKIVVARSELAELELLGDWVIQIDWASCSIPGGVTLNGQPVTP